MPTLLTPSRTQRTIDDATRRDLLKGAGALGVGWVLAGCGTTMTRSDGPGSGGTWTVRHALGTAEVPVAPQRVVAGNQIGLEAALALGAPVVGAATPNLTGARGRQFEGRLDGVEPIGTESEPNLEQVAALDPDLVLGFTWGGFPDLYDTYMQIAPTVVIEFTQHAAWKDALRQAASALNAGEAAQRALADYDARVEQLRDALGELVRETSVSVIRFYQGEANSEFRTRHASFPGSILDDVGFPQPPAQARASDPSDPSQFFVEVSPERVELLDGDVIFVALDPGAEEAFETFGRNPLWQRLEGITNDRVHTVDSGYWIFGNVLSANAILDDLQASLLPGRS